MDLGFLASITKACGIKEKKVMNENEEKKNTFFNFNFKIHPIEVYKMKEDRYADFIYDKPYGEVKEVNGQKLICCYQEDNGDGFLQINFNTLNSYDNNSYGVVYKPNETGDNKQAVCFTYKSHCLAPPVWDRLFMEIDFVDLNCIKCAINNIIEKNYKNNKKFNLEKRSGHFIAMYDGSATYEEIKGGKQYGVLAIKAEKVDKKITIIDYNDKTFVV